MANVEQLAKLKKPFEAYEGDAPYVFVSYSHQDVEIVFIELVRLKKLGFQVWYDEGISPGSRWSDALAERIANCTLFLYYVTPRSVASENCQDEANYVLEAGNPFLAVHLEPTELPPGLKLRMGSRQAILRYQLDTEAYLSKLFSAVTAQAPELVQVDLRQGFRLGDYKVEPLSGDVTGQDSETHHLQPKVMEVLVHLAEHAGELVTRDQLLDAVWPGQVAADELLTRAISELRRVVQDDGHKKYIETVPKRGYRLSGEIRPTAAARITKKSSVTSFDRLQASVTKGVAADKSGIKVSIRRKTRVIALGVLAAIVAGVTISELIPVSAPPAVSDYTRLTQSQVLFPPEPSPAPLVTDASRIYFNDWESGWLGVRQLSQTGGEATRIASPFRQNRGEFYPLAMSSDGSQLLVSTFAFDESFDWALWLWPVVGGNPRRLGDGFDAAYSPDGDRLVYTIGDNKLFVANADMSDARLLATAPARVYWPRFSPDGQRIRFSAIAGTRATRALYEVAVDGTGLHRVLPEWDAIKHCCGSWTPDGKYYVFHAEHDFRTQIWALHEDDGLFGKRQSAPTQITSGALDFSRPTISGNGDKIFAIGWQLRGEVVRFDSAAGRFVPMPSFDSVSAEWISYSSDEAWVAYVSYPEANLWRSRSDGSNRLQLTFPPMLVCNPVWSPDGQTLAFEGRIPGKPAQIFMISANGGVLRPMPTEAGVRTYDPSWSPDGNSLAFAAYGKDKVQVLDLTTETVTELAGSDDTEAVTELEESDYLVAARWSPDGRYIAAYRNGSLHLFDFENRQYEALIELDSYFYHYWARDSQHVYFIDASNRGADRAVYRVNIRDKSVEKIVTVGRIRTVWGVWDMWIGLTPDGSPMLLRDLSIHHIYALDWPRD